MNILVVVPWDQEFGGVAFVVGHLARYLRDQGHQVFLFHPGDSNYLARNTTKWGFPGYRLNIRAPYYSEHPLRTLLSYLTYFVPTVVQLLRLLLRHNIQVVNVHYPGEEFAFFALCRWLLPIRLVTSVHGADCFPVGRPMRSYPWTLRLLLSSSDAVVTPSKALLQDFLTAFPHLSQKATFIHNGVDLEELNQSLEDTSPPIKERYLLCIATHNEKKALDVLIRAFAIFKDGDPKVRLLLVGDGPLRRQNEELAKALDLDQRVEFLGWRGRAEIARLLHGCEVFVLPSRSEPFGIAILEAMACRKPVVASAVGGILEIIDHGKTGVLVEPDDPPALAHALLDLLKDHSLQRSISSNGYTRVTAQFQCEHTGAAYERLFESLATPQHKEVSFSAQATTRKQGVSSPSQP